MLKLIKAELFYQKYTLAAFPTLAAAIIFWSDEVSFLALLIPFMMVNTANLIRNSENRDRLYAMLPVSLGQAATARILLVVLPCLGWYAVYLMLAGLFRELDLNAMRTAMVFFSLILSAYSIGFAANDAILLSKTATKSILAGLVALGMLTFVLGVLAFTLFSKGPDASPIGLRAIFEMIEANNPFAGLSGNLLLLALSLALAALSAATYVRRRSYLCTE